MHGPAPARGRDAAARRAGDHSPSALQRRPNCYEIIRHIRGTYGLVPRSDRLRARGLVPLAEAAERLGVSTATVKVWHRDGLLAGEKMNDKNEHYYRVPEVVPRKLIGRASGTKNRPKEITIANNSGGAV